MYFWIIIRSLSDVITLCRLVTRMSFTSAKFVSTRTRLGLS